MATPHSDEHHATETAWSKFPEEEQHSLMVEDSAAWNDVTKILLTIVAIGLALSVLTLFLNRNPAATHSHPAATSHK